MIDFAPLETRNHFTARQYVRRLHRKMNWALVGKDVVVLTVACFVAGLLLGFALLALTWR
jgi:hypothetical protein